ncbi:hypothetical protein [Nitrospirillum pindoramense]|uniref:Uncharacterized protein n=1 Tax=Nitrospirillum amazonense TaxID=28077 RepID=A0A560H3W9_9PROT|nr:hypothetical protein [Nitrospirillum amazonense]TWB40404.1 hypothetical protein FBZ90_1097 [Nitrospirillum amazonense]
MLASINRISRRSAKALILFSVMSGTAFAAQDQDPAKVFVASLMGNREPVARSVVSPVSLPETDPARRFIDGLQGKRNDLFRPAAPATVSRPDQDFINRLGGRAS